MSLNLFLHKFMEYVFENCCNCTEKECIISITEKYLPEYYNFIKMKYMKKNLKMCSQINNKEYNLENSIKGFDIPLYLIDELKKFSLLNIKNNKFYLLNSSSKLNWKNIKGISIKMAENYIIQYPKNAIDIYNYFNISKIESKNQIKINIFIIHLKIIFWYIRKGIIDTIVGTIINKNNYSVNALSVGSTNLESDYDITLYGNYDETYKVINSFKTIFKEILQNKSSYIFDTNLYGVSFIKKEEDNKNKNTLTCNNFNFTTTKDLISIEQKITQHIWAIIKFTNSLNFIKESNELLYEMLSDVIVNELRDFNVSELLQLGEDFINVFESNTSNYDKIIRYLINIDDSEINNFISFINYNGQETYFTRGAFIDIVVNNQMCKNEIVKLSDDEILDSFIENVSDLMVHYNKSKYVERIKKSTERLNKLNIQNIKKLEKIQQNCKSIDVLEECEIFKFYKLCVLIIIDAFKKYMILSDEEINKGINLFKIMSEKLPIFTDKSINKSSSFYNLSKNSSATSSLYNLSKSNSNLVNLI